MAQLSASHPVLACGCFSEGISALATSPHARSKAAAWELSASLVDTLLGIILGTHGGLLCRDDQGSTVAKDQEQQQQEQHRQEDGQDEGPQVEGDVQQQQQREGEGQSGGDRHGQGLAQGDVWEGAFLSWGGEPLRYQVLGLLVRLACREPTLGQTALLRAEQRLVGEAKPLLRNDSGGAAPGVPLGFRRCGDLYVCWDVWGRVLLRSSRC